MLLIQVFSVMGSMTAQMPGMKSGVDLAKLFYTDQIIYGGSISEDRGAPTYLIYCFVFTIKEIKI